MKFLENTQKTFLCYLERLGLAWWVKIVTDNPRCTYYFGPFGSEQHAKVNQLGYIEDLKEENAQIKLVEIKQGQPHYFTIYNNEIPDKFESSILINLYQSIPFKR